MADNAIALQVQTPDSFKTIGSVLDMARGAQALKSAQQEYQSKNIELQKQTQVNQERVATQQFMSNPDNYQTNGRIDLDKINKTLPSIAPLTGAETIEHLTKLGTAQTEAEQAKLKFTDTERGILGGLYGVAGRAGFTPEQLAAEMDNLKSQYKDSSSMVKYIDNAKVGLKLMKPGDAFIKTLVTQSQSLLSPGAQQSSLSPTVGLQPTGGQLNETIVQPAVGGNQPSVTMTGRSQPLTISPEGRESVVIDPNTQNTNVVTKDAAGRIVAARPAPGSGAQGAGGGQSTFARYYPGQKADIEHAQQEVTSIRSAGDAVPQARNINQQILRLSRDTTTGPGTAGWQKAIGSVAALWGGSASNYQELGKYLEKNALQNLQAMGGPPSDARLSAAAAANGSTEFNPKALQDVTKFNDATTSALEKYRQGVDKAVGLANSDYTKLPAFKAEWAKNMDVDIFRVENAVRDGDKAELEKLKKELGPQRLKELRQKRLNLKALSESGRLQ